MSNIRKLMRMVEDSTENDEYGQLMYDLTYSLAHMIGHSNQPESAFFSCQKTMMAIIDDLKAQHEKDELRPTEH